MERDPKAEGVLQAEKELDGKGWLPTALHAPEVAGESMPIAAE
ncbi:hypothetical protein [Mesorhizobium sp.]|nr:hypothetical protein [Mesorhizobium sp.]